MADPLVVLQRGDDPKVVVSAKGTEKVGDLEGQVLLVNVDGQQTRWVVDPKTGYVIRTARTAWKPPR